VKIYQKTNTNAFICLIGIDGSGKTTQAVKLAEAIRGEGIRVKYVWIGWVPTMLNPIIKLGKLLLIRRKNIDETNYEDFTMVKKDLFGNRLLAQLWMYYVLFDYAIQIFIKVTIPLLLGRVVICDRYIYDIFVNLSTSYGLPEDDVLKLPKSRKVLFLFPKPTYVFFLDASERIAFERKDDVPSMDYLVEHRRFYSKICDKVGVTRIDSSDAPEQIHRQLTEKVFQYLGKWAIK